MKTSLKKKPSFKMAILVIIYLYSVWLALHDLNMFLGQYFVSSGEPFEALFLVSAYASPGLLILLSLWNRRLAGLLILIVSAILPMLMLLADPRDGLAFLLLRYLLPSCVLGLAFIAYHSWQSGVPKNFDEDASR